MDLQVQITHLDDAHEQVDHAIAEALRQQKPVYISISCNIAGIPHRTFDEVPVPFAIEPKLSNPRSALPPARVLERCCPQHRSLLYVLCRSLEAAVKAAAEFLNKAVKPVLVAGVKLRPSHAEDAFLKLADACGSFPDPSATSCLFLEAARLPLANLADKTFSCCVLHERHRHDFLVAICRVSGRHPAECQGHVPRGPRSLHR